MNINALIAQFNNTSLSPPVWSYQHIAREILQRPTEAVTVIQHALQYITSAFGNYGSPNMGPRGVAYNELRQALLTFHSDPNSALVNHNIQNASFNFRNVIDYISEPIRNLPAYTSSEQSQGQAKVDLEDAIAATKQRIQHCIAILHVQNMLDSHEDASFHVNWASF